MTISMPRRSVLCLPASSERAIAKLATLDMDAVILDLEDAVAETRKAEGRANIRAFLTSSMRPKDRTVVVRVNDRHSSHFSDDMALVLESNPDAVLLPKARSADDILEVANLLDDRDMPDTLKIWAMMETPLAILNAGFIAETGRTRGGRLECLVVGLNDLRKDTGVRADPQRSYLVPWLMQVVLAGRAYGLGVIDAVCNEFRDLSVFETECEQGRNMGFDGKMLIHPSQVDATNRIFAPSDGDLAEARRIIEVFSAPEAESLNAIDVDGRMVERLHYEQALALTKKADLIANRNNR